MKKVSPLIVGLVACSAFLCQLHFIMGAFTVSGEMYDSTLAAIQVFPFISGGFGLLTAAIFIGALWGSEAEGFSMLYVLLFGLSSALSATTMGLWAYSADEELFATVVVISVTAGITFVTWAVAGILLLLHSMQRSKYEIQ